MGCNFIMTFSIARVLCHCINTPAFDMRAFDSSSICANHGLYARRIRSRLQFGTCTEASGVTIPFLDGLVAFALRDE